MNNTTETHNNISTIERIISGFVFSLIIFGGILGYGVVLPIIWQFTNTNFKNPFYRLAVGLAVVDMGYLISGGVCLTVITHTHTHTHKHKHTYTQTHTHTLSHTHTRLLAPTHIHTQLQFPDPNNHIRIFLV